MVILGSHFRIFVLNILTIPEFLISNGTMLYTLEAKYLSEFRPNLLVFTQILAESVCDLYIVWKIYFNLK